MSEIDSTLVYMDLSDAQKFFELGNAVTNIEIRVRDVYHAQSVAQEIQRQLGISLPDGAGRVFGLICFRP